MMVPIESTISDTAPEPGSSSRFHIKITARLIIAVIILGFWIFAAIAAPMIAPYSPTAINSNAALQPPSFAHICGTDQLGRDIFSRILYGAQDALLIAVGSVGVGAGVGTMLGIIAGYRTGIMSWIIMRLTDILLAIPSIVIAMVVITIAGEGVIDLIVAIAVSEIPIFIRLARSSTLSLRSTMFVEAAEAAGASSWRIIVVHLLRNLIGSIVVLGVIDMGASILAVAGLTFIGLGPPPPQPEWGAMITQAQQYIPSNWWMAVFPGLAIVSAVLALNMLADESQQYFDPQQMSRKQG